MLFNEFRELDETEQVEILWYNGEQIGRRKEQGYLVLLYQVEGFYVEVFYHRKQRVIKRYLSFESDDRRLLPYLDKIDISPIYRQIKKTPRSSDPRLRNYFVSMVMDEPRQEMIRLRERNKNGKIKTSLWDILVKVFLKTDKEW